MMGDYQSCYELTSGYGSVGTQGVKFPRKGNFILPPCCCRTLLLQQL